MLGYEKQAMKKHVSPTLSTQLQHLKAYYMLTSTLPAVFQGLRVYIQNT
jgi:hypothetical protein